MGFLVALRFLTTIPVPWVKEIKPRNRGGSLAYFPLIGLILGIILAIADMMLSLILPSSMVNIALVIILIFLTGALHLDGLVDSSDGVFAAKPPEERLRIMSETRVGAFGIVGVIVLLLVKWISLDTFPHTLSPISILDNLLGTFRLPALVLMPVLGRWAMVYAICSYPAAKKEGMAAEFKQYARWTSLLLATIITFLIAIGLALALGIVLTSILLIVAVLMAAIWLMVAAVAFFLRRRLGGLTGDNLGAIAELSEVAVLVFTFVYFSIRLRIG